MSAIYGLRQKDKSVKITLVDPKEYCEIFWASYRSPFDEGVAKDSLIYLSKFCEANNATFVQATVTKLTKKNCQAKLIKDGSSQTLGFDVCVVATGANAAWQGM